LAKSVENFLAIMLIQTHTRRDAHKLMPSFWAYVQNGYTSKVEPPFNSSTYQQRYSR